MPDMVAKCGFEDSAKVLGNGTNVDNAFKDALCDDFDHCPELDDSKVHDQNSNDLEGALLNEALDNTTDLFVTITPASPSGLIKQEKNTHSMEESSDLQPLTGAQPLSYTEEDNPMLGSPRTTFNLSPSAHIQGISRNPASYAPHTLGHRYQHKRNPSNLRNLYNPNHLYQTPPLSTNYNSVSYATNPARYNDPYQYYRGQGTMALPIHQPFDESNVRTSVNHPLTRIQPKPQAYSEYSLSPNYSPSTPARSPHMDVNTQHEQPRTPCRIVNLGEFQHHPSITGSSAGSITHGVTSPHSPTPHLKGEDSTGKRRHKAVASDSDQDAVQLPKDVSEQDAPLIQRLIAAMTDGSNAEDNEGMLKTWDKIRVTRPEKVQAKAIEMLRLCREAQREAISGKKAIHQYPSFRVRFEELCKAVKTQKTICKHLMEEEYTRTVAKDPTFAAQRVKNNRRVNDQKKIAIEVGRRQMGQKGHGKGRRVENVDLFEDEEDFPNDNSSEEDGNSSSLDNKADPPNRKKVKKNRRSSMDDDFEIITRTTPASRRTRRQTRSATKAIGHFDSSASPVFNRTTRQSMTGQAHIQAAHSSPAGQQFQTDHGNGHCQSYSFENGSYAFLTPNGIPQMVEEHSASLFGHPSIYHVDPRYEQTGYPEGTDATFSDDIDGHGETDTDIYGDSSFNIFGSSQ